MGKQAVLEKLAVVAAVIVIVTAGWFWSAQIGDVLETLKLAYG